MTIAALARVTVASACAFLVVSCGGGGSAGATGSTSPTPPASSATVSVSAPSVSMSVDVTQNTPLPVVLQAKVANAPATTLADTVTFSGSGVAAAVFAWQSSADGTLTVSFPSPKSLGPGTYQGTIHLSVCSDSACQHQVSGSPLTIPVTYTITNDSPPPTTFFLSTSLLSYKSNTAVTTPQNATFSIDVHNIPPGGVYVIITQPAGGFITNISYVEGPLSSGPADAVGEFTVTLVSPASLGSGYFNSSVTFSVCLDQACTQPLAGSPATEPIYYSVFLTPGKEFTLHSNDAGGIADLAYDSADHKIYVVGLAGYANAFSGAVTQVDPATGMPGTQMALNDSLATLAASGDGRYLYAGSATNPVVHRLAVPLASSLDIPLGTSGGSANIAAQLAVPPGQPQSVTVATKHTSGLYTAGTYIYDGAVPRADSLTPVGPNASPDSLAWSESGSLLYALRYSYQLPFLLSLDQASADSSGLNVTSSMSLLPMIQGDGVEQIRYAQGRIYDMSGYVRDAATGVVLGNIAVPSQLGVVAPAQTIVGVIPDVINNHIFVLVSYTDLFLFCYDTQTLSLQSMYDFGYDSFDVALSTDLILWGTNGLAFNRNGVQILSGTFTATPVASTTTQVAARRALTRTFHLRSRKEARGAQK